MNIFEFNIQIVLMRLMDKLKELFIDVEEVEEEEEEVVVEPPKRAKKEVKEEKIKIKEEPKFKLPKVMQDSIEDEKKEETLKLNSNVKPKNDDFREMVPRSRVQSHNYELDINFEKPHLSSNQNVLTKKKEEPKKVAQLYSESKKSTIKPKEEEKPKKFMASPVISPVYGVLDKNYKTDELLAKTEESYEMQRKSKKIDFESVRRKAFGNLTDDIKNNLCEDCELLKEVKRLEKLNDEELLSDLLIDNEPQEKPISIETAYDNYSDFGVSYEIDSSNKQVTELEETREIKIVNHNDTETVAEKIEVTDPEIEKKVVKEPSPEDTKLTEDLFDLIDSMYKERES